MPDTSISTGGLGIAESTSITPLPFFTCDPERMDSDMVDRFCSIYMKNMDQFILYYNEINKINKKQNTIYHFYLKKFEEFIQLFKDIQQEIFSQGSMITINATTLDSFILSIRQIEEDIRHTQDIVQKLDENAVSGKNTIKDSIDLIKQIGEITGNISSNIHQIELISEKTHVLSINASIEASRHGNQGKGFTVIAQEIRQLASSAHKSTESIRMMVHSISDAIEEESAVIKENGDRFVNISEQVKETNTLITDISVTLTKKGKIFNRLQDWMSKMTDLTENVERLIVTQQSEMDIFTHLLSDLITVNHKIEHFNLFLPIIDYKECCKDGNVSAIHEINLHIDEYLGFLVEIENQFSVLNNQLSGEKRIAERVEVRLDCQYLAIHFNNGHYDPSSFDTQPDVQHGSLVNLSSTGALLEANGPIESDGSIYICFSLSTVLKTNNRSFQNQKIYTRAEIMNQKRIHQENDSLQPLYQAGVHFVDLSPAQRAYIASFLYT